MQLSVSPVSRPGWDSAEEPGWVHSPDQDTLALQPLPQRAVALVSDGEDVRGDFAEVVTAVALHGGPVVQTRQQLVRVDRRQDGADVGLPTEKHAALALMLAQRAATMRRRGPKQEVRSDKTRLQLHANDITTGEPR